MAPPSGPREPVAAEAGGGGGAPASGSRIEKGEWIARWVTALASLWFTAAASWELSGPFGAGHVASMTAVGIAAENILQHGILAPVTHYTAGVPLPSEYYCHHPWGIFWLTAAFIRVFGAHDWVLRVPAILMSGLTPAVLYLGGRALWGPAAGAATAVAFTVLPISLSFANFNSLEVPVMLGVAASIWATARFEQTWRRRWLAGSILGLLWAMNSDWAGTYYTGALLLLAAVRGLFLSQRWFEPVDARRYWQWWVWLALGAAVLGLFYGYQFFQASQLDDFIAQGSLRSRGANRPLGEVLASRRHWIELMFTPWAIALGKVAVPVLALRVLCWRRALEVLPLIVLGMASVQYLVFAEGASVHIFWPHYFALYFAYAVGSLVATSIDLRRYGLLTFARRRRIRRVGPGIWGRWPEILSGAILLGWSFAILCILPDGVRALRYARRTGMRFDEKGLIIHQDLDKVAVLRHLRPRLDPGALAGVHPSMKHSWAIDWSLRLPIVHAFDAERPATRYGFLDSRFMRGEELRAVAERYEVEAYGPFWFVDCQAPPGPVRGFRIARREPSTIEWLLVQAHDPIMTVEPDPGWTWELREHLGQAPNPRPELATNGATLAGQRVLHNVAVAHGQRVTAERLLAEIQGSLHGRVDEGSGSPEPGSGGAAATEAWARGARWLGWRVEPGVAPLLAVLVQAARPEPAPLVIAVKSRVESCPWASLVPSPELTRDVGMPFDLPSSLWRPGFLYSAESEIRPRPGSERYDAAPAGPRAAWETRAREPVTVLRTP